MSYDSILYPTDRVTPEILALFKAYSARMPDVVLRHHAFLGLRKGWSSTLHWDAYEIEGSCIICRSASELRRALIFQFTLGAQDARPSVYP